ncbi:TniQ family protein [Endozoicomonadaceae bacterium StTr2]
MDFYFPSPLPDESLYSLIVRYRKSLPYNNNHAARYTFGYEGAFGTPTFIGQNALTFYEQYSEFWRNERGFIRSMTGINLLFPFLKKAIQDRLYKAVKGYTGQVIPLLSPYLYFPNHQFSTLKYCENCVNQDIKEHGIAYWHRSHCVWIVDVCWKHGIALEKSQIETRFQLPPQEYSQKQSKQVYQAIQTIAVLIHDLLYGKLPWIITLPALHACYQSYLNQQTASIKKAANRIQEELEQIYTPETLCNLGIREKYNGTGRRPWVYDVLNTKLPVHIPEHLLVIRHLFGSVSALGKVIANPPRYS